MVTTNDANLAHKIRLLRSHAMTSITWDRYQGHAWSYDVVGLGYNYRIDEIRSALGITQLKKLKLNNQKRRSLTNYYWQALNQMVPEVRTPFCRHSGESSNHILPIILPVGANRPEIMERMKEQGIQTSIHYPPIHLFSYYRQLDSTVALEITEDLAKRELTLPLFPGLENTDVKSVVRALADSL